MEEYVDFDWDTCSEADLVSSEVETGASHASTIDESTFTSPKLKRDLKAACHRQIVR